MATALNTRKPTLQVPPPNILLEGEEGAGKTFAAFALAASARIDQFYVIDVGEGCADQYGSLGSYQIVVHDGTLESIREQCRAIAAQPVDPNRPSVAAFDSVSALWAMCKQWAEDQARDRARRNAEKYNKVFDADAEPNITMDLWNRATTRFYSVLEPLLDWPGIVILVARGREVVALDDNGRPLQGKTTWSGEYQKNLSFGVDVVLRATQPRKLHVVKARTLKLTLPADKFLDVTGTTLDTFIFDMLGVEGSVSRETVRPDQSVDNSQVKVWLLEELAVVFNGDMAAAKAAASAAWRGEKLPAKGGTMTKGVAEAFIEAAVVSARESAATPAAAPAGDPDVVAVPDVDGEPNPYNEALGATTEGGAA